MTQTGRTRKRYEKFLADTLKDFEKLGLPTGVFEGVSLKIIRPFMAFAKFRYEDSEILIPYRRIYRGKHPQAKASIAHELGHFLVYHYYYKFTTLDFTSIFGGISIYGSGNGEYKRALHVTGYASTNSQEDFCEVLSKYFVHSGDIPNKWKKRPIVRLKWQFITNLINELSTDYRTANSKS